MLIFITASLRFLLPDKSAWKEVALIGRLCDLKKQGTLFIPLAFSACVTTQQFHARFRFTTFINTAVSHHRLHSPMLSQQDSS
jgi:hypothetical protein